VSFHTFHAAPSLTSGLVPGLPRIDRGLRRGTMLDFLRANNYLRGNLHQGIGKETCVTTSKLCTTSNHRPRKKRFARQRFSLRGSSVASTNPQRPTKPPSITQLTR